jgi:uncharacterized protein (DUF305 family)
MTSFTVRRRVLLAGLAGVAALAFTAGCGGDDTNGNDDGGAGTGATTEASTGAFNDADVTFAQNMIPHHQAAIEMAELAGTRAANAEIKEIAEQITAAQGPEITTLKSWLNAWGEPTMSAGGHEGMEEVPGMMSDEEMQQLEAAKGAEFDRMFATAMIAHHNGAIQMARDEQAQGANADAKAMAATIERTQAEEVTRLQKILDQL